MGLKIAFPYKIPEAFQDDLIYKVRFFVNGIEDVAITESQVEITINPDNIQNQEELSRLIGSICADLQSESPLEKKVIYRQPYSGTYNQNVLAELHQRKLIVEKSPGRVYFHGVVYDLFEAFSKLFLELAEQFDAKVHNYPSFISVEELDRCKYVDSFAQYLTYATHLQEDIESIRTFLQKRSHESLQKPGYAMNPAMCLHCYSEYADSEIGGDMALTTVGRCFRYESNNLHSFERLWEFTLREIVFIGTPEYVFQRRNEAMEATIALVEQLGLAGQIETTSDPFFLDAKTLKKFQIHSEAKYELRMDLPYKNGSLAVASFNVHRDHFGRSFGMSQPDLSYAHSSCVGYGIERWVLAFLAQYGLDSAGWPERIKKLL